MCNLWDEEDIPMAFMVQLLQTFLHGLNPQSYTVHWIQCDFTWASHGILCTLYNPAVELEIRDGKEKEVITISRTKKFSPLFHRSKIERVTQRAYMVKTPQGEAFATRKTELAKLLRVLTTYEWTDRFSNNRRFELWVKAVQQKNMSLAPPSADFLLRGAYPMDKIPLPPPETMIQKCLRRSTFLHRNLWNTMILALRTLDKITRFIVWQYVVASQYNVTFSRGDHVDVIDDLIYNVDYTTGQSCPYYQLPPWCDITEEQMEEHDPEYDPDKIDFDRVVKKSNQALPPTQNSPRRPRPPQETKSAPQQKKTEAQEKHEEVPWTVVKSRRSKKQQRKK
jgi:hypothetical protein